MDLSGPLMPLSVYFLVLSATFGLLIGSFMNVLIYRLPRKLPFALERSFCPSCGHKLGAADLVPLFSWLFLGGRCRYCRERISLRYPLVELAGGVCFALSFVRFGLSPRTLIYDFVFCVLIFISEVDRDTMEIPDGAVICVAAAGLLDALCVPIPLERLIGAFCVSVPLLVVALVTGGMGGGDVKLTAACGLLLGWRLMLFAILAAFIAGGVKAVVLMLRGKAKRGTQVVFGGCISLGCACAVFFGDTAINAYLTLFTVV